MLEARMAVHETAADDVEEIRQLKARYFRTMDTKDWAAFAALFTPQAVVDTTAAGGERVVGIERLVNDHLRPVHADTITVHHGHMPEIEFTSTTTATGVWAMQGWVWWKSGRSLQNFGHYHDTYEFIDSKWMITSVTLTTLHEIWTDENSAAG
jgi:SnoaL-like domain